VTQAAIGTTHAILGAAAGLALALAVVALILAILVMRQSAEALRDLRAHRTAHRRTTGRDDPDPEHHGTSPTVARLADDMRRLDADLETLGTLFAELTDWARHVDHIVRAPDTPADATTPATTQMPTTPPRPEAGRP
jgi:hypothetical protein